jgi:hypothetical protein
MSATTGRLRDTRRRRRSITPRGTDGMNIPSGIFDFAGILQADAYDGHNELYEPSRLPGPVT